MLAVIFIAYVLVVGLFALAIVIWMIGRIDDNTQEYRRLNRKLDRHIEIHLTPEQRRELERIREEIEEDKRSKFGHGG